MKVVDMKRLPVVIVVSVIMLASCSKNDEKLNSTEVEIVSSELLSEACVAETSEMGFVILNTLSDSQLGTALATESIPNFSLIDSLLMGATFAVSGTGGLDNPQGAITIDFKSTGTTDRNGVIRKGIVTINYSGRRWAVGSSRTISFSGYSRNNVKLADTTTYTITVKDSSKTALDFHHVLKSCVLTFPDQRSFFREADFNSRVNFKLKTTTLYANDTCAVGRTRYGESFFSFITDSIVYRPQCIGAKMYLPNKGNKNITVGSSTYAVTYGSTLTCGRTVGVIAGDKAATITVNSDGN
ncbi:MAG TPA: hypothetical protein VGQ59_10000 [Cyclobacteriaceae bacterium]|nr:hypothetical protein [Cyclobacteriaceae bacterium]